MLKNVVLPAPLGPMIETIERSGIENETSLTATRPPKTLETPSAVSRSRRRVRRVRAWSVLGRVAHARTS